MPEGVSASDWSSIRAAYEAHRHAAFAIDGGYQTRNPGQQWRTRFDGCGFLTTPDAGGWSWGLELMSYGHAGAEQAVTAPSCVEADGGRVAYPWDDTLTEWYVNDPRGLEHGYTIQRRPECTTGGTPMPPLQLTLAVRGDLRPRVNAAGSGVTFVNDSGAAVVNYHGLSVLDADGAALSAWFEVSSEALVLSVDDRDARYPLAIDPIAQQAYLKASNTDASDFFGFKVAVSGDTVVVGAEGEDSSATGVDGNQADNSAAHAGAAYVFVRDAGDVWTQQAYLKASNTDARDEFGRSVSISGDTVVVGANREDSSATGVDGNQADNSANDAGAAYVFVRDAGGVWSQQAYLKASNTDGGDQFGISVAVSGDTVVVGAFLEDSSATGVDGNQADNSAFAAGAAYVFVRDPGGVWSQQAYLKASNTDGAVLPDIVGDLFGFSLGVSGDTVVVGALAEDSSATGVDGNQADNSAPRAGAAYVFVRDSGGVWSQQAYLKASNTDAIDEFGISVAVSGDTVVVGAVFEDSNATGVDGNQADNSASGAGAAYVFVRDAGDVWSQQAYLKASNPGIGDFFGGSVAVSGDTIVVGAWREDSSATGVNGNQADNSVFDAGAAYVFVLPPDCNANGIPDVTDIANGTSQDCNGNTIPDECDIADASSSDNVGAGGSPDGIPDECQLDCNGNLIPDDIDISDGTSPDCNANGIPDECDISSGASGDCDGNAIPDECDIADCAAGDPTCDDCNNNGQPDMCDVPTSTGCPDGNCAQNCSLDANEDCVPDECIVWDGETGTDLWSEPLNWDQDIVPDNAPGLLGPQQTFAVNIPGSTSVVTLDIQAEIDSLRLLDGAILNITQGDLTIETTNGILVGGDMTVGDGHAIIAAAPDGAMPITGSTAVALAGVTAALSSAAPENLLTNSTQIAGEGVIDASFVNETTGTVDANAMNTILTVTGSNTKTNDGTFRASAAGTLRIENTSVTGIGDYDADSGDIEVLPGAGTVSVTGTNMNIANTGRVHVDGNAQLSMQSMVAIDSCGAYEAVPDATGAVSAHMTAGQVQIGETTPGSGGAMTLTDSMSVDVTTNITVQGSTQGLPLGGCTTPRLGIANTASMQAGSLSIIDGGAVELTDNAAMVIGNDLLMAIDASCVGVNLGGCTTPRLHAVNTSQMTIDGNLLIPALADITVSVPFDAADPLVTLAGDFVNESTDPATFHWDTGPLSLNGVAARSFETAGRDMGPIPAGFTDNFAMGTIDVLQGSHVVFVDAIDNDQSGQTPCSEALYVHDLILRAGSTVTLNRTTVYYETITDEGANVEQIDCGQLRLVCAGDLTGDCLVTIEDYESFLTCVTDADSGPFADGCARADFDHDGDIDFADFGQLQLAFHGGDN